MSRLPTATPVRPPQSEPGDWNASKELAGEPPNAPHQIGVWIARGALGVLGMILRHSRVNGGFTDDWREVLKQALTDTLDAVENAK